MAVLQRTNDLQSSYEIGKQEGLQIAKLDKFKATQEWVNKWRQENGVGPNVTPSKDIVPFKWMHPFLHKVQTDSLQIAGDPSFTVGGSKGSSRNKKIMSSGDANAPNAKEFMEKLQLGPAMFPIKKAEVDYSDIPNAKDLQIRDAIQKYGKDKKGKYKNPELLIRNLPRA